MWLELRCASSGSEADELEAWFRGQGALSGAIEPDLRFPEDEVFGEPGMPEQALWAHCWVVTLWPEAISLEHLWIEYGLRFNRPVLEHEVRRLDDQDWVRMTQMQFTPQHIGQDFWVVPSWHEPPTSARLVLHLDPGQAFGTGTHPTTALCLRWLLNQPLMDRKVLDYGCGSGILAMAMSLLGGQQVVGVDIDPVAVTTAQANAQKNGLDVSFLAADELTDPLFDGVVANILWAPLMQLAPLLATKVKRNGWLTLSGLLERQQESIQEAYAPWFILKVVGVEEGWICLSGQKHSD
ncbi:MAG: 50S ribosomal protein L11 methyltransferase [Ferrovum sp.]|jgi:ribosomal protein L11 methyltransferase|nr:50S ribosomal protein L11 methyltransferase [Ferrovum sp.]